jgi:N-acetylmuramoyl-L-alanine amidase
MDIENFEQQRRDQDAEHEHENCLVINEIDSGGTRASFNGLLRDAPGCATMVANVLSQQSIHEVNVLLEEATGKSSELLVSFDTLNVDLGDAAYPYLQPPAVAALEKAILDRGTRMTVNSAYRTLAQQFLLYSWWNDGACAFQAVAPPGASDHQAGLAIDIEDYDNWRPYLERQGWEWFGPGDRPHFTYVKSDRIEFIKIKGESIDTRFTATLAFQRLWNRNNPGAKIGEDGDYGSVTEGKLKLSPANGFKLAPWDQKPRLLRLSLPRMEGSDVEGLQTALKKAGASLVIDGEFGPGTDKAVKEFQKQKKLNIDGIVGPLTKAAMA